MKEVWKEIVYGIGIKPILTTLLSFILLLILALALLSCYSWRDTPKPQLESNTNHHIINPLQTNFTS